MFKQNCKILAKTKDTVKNRILRAVGVDVNSAFSKVDWETYLLLTKVMNLKCKDREQQLRFVVRLFDPAWSGSCKSSEFEHIWSEIFVNEDEGG